MKQTYYVVVFCPYGDASKCYPCEDAIFTDKARAEEDFANWNNWLDREWYLLVEIELTAEEAEAIRRNEGEPIP